MANGEQDRPHFSVSSDSIIQNDRITTSFEIQGDYNTLLADGLPVIPSNIRTIAGIVQVPSPKGISTNGGVFISSYNLRRVAAGRGVVTGTITKLLNVEQWSIEYSEVSKNIWAWQPKDGRLEDADLAKVKQWKKLVELGNGGNLDWKYEEGENAKALEGNALELAKKIYKGIDSYPLYVPVATRTTTWVAGSIDDLGAGLGCQTDTLSSRGGWVEVSQTGSVVNGINNLITGMPGGKGVWVKTCDRAQINQDGTQTRVEQWTAVTEADKDLYPA